MLNFTGTDNFLCCTNKIEDIEEKILQIKVRFNNLLFFDFASSSAFLCKLHKYVYCAQIWYYMVFLFNFNFSCLFQMYDRKKMCISADDPEKACLIFYMSQKCDGLRYFESALHRGWFIHTVNDDVVKMKRGNTTSSSCFVLE